MSMLNVDARVSFRVWLTAGVAALFLGILASAVSGAETWEPAAADRPVLEGRPSPSSSPYRRSSWILTDLGSVDGKVFDLALGAASCAVRAGAVGDPSTLTVIDYSKPSTARRLWVFDLRARKLLWEELVAHGQGTGDNLARRFSNADGTHQTSLGLFVTGETYVGSNGYSLRLDGLDHGVNDRARARAIVMHGAPYVSEAFIQANGRLGRSWGCPALRADIARQVIDRVKGGSLVFSYYPDQDWLGTSEYLGRCAAAD
jgi:hypothetical protein